MVDNDLNSTLYGVDWSTHKIFVKYKRFPGSILVVASFDYTRCPKSTKSWLVQNGLNPKNFNLWARKMSYGGLIFNMVVFKGLHDYNNI